MWIPADRRWEFVLMPSLLAAAGLLFSLCGGLALAEPGNETGVSAGEPEVVLYYFHGARRCKTCRSIETYSEEAIKTGFGDQLQNGTLKWKVVDTDEPANAHFIEQFDLVGSSLVVVRMKDGEVARHEVLQQVWTLVRDQPRFAEYVRQSVGEFLR